MPAQDLLGAHQLQLTEAGGDAGLLGRGRVVPEYVLGVVVHGQTIGAVPGGARPPTGDHDQAAPPRARAGAGDRFSIMAMTSSGR